MYDRPKQTIVYVDMFTTHPPHPPITVRKLTHSPPKHSTRVRGRREVARNVSIMVRYEYSYNTQGVV